MGSNPIFRSITFSGGVAKRLRQGSAKPLFSGSNPLAALTVPRWRNGRRGGLKIRSPKGGVGSSPSLGIIRIFLTSSARVDKLQLTTVI